MNASLEKTSENAPGGAGTDKKLDRIEIVKRVFAEQSGISVEDMDGKRRFQRIVWPRQMAMNARYERHLGSLYKIADRFGGRDHGTVLHARKMVKNRLETNHGDDRERYSRACRIVDEKLGRASATI